MWLSAVGLILFGAGCGDGQVEVDAAPVPEFLASVGDEERFRLSEAFGSDWAYAIAASCPGDELVIEGVTVSTEYFGCEDSDSDSETWNSVALVDADGQLVRFYPESEGAWAVFGCFEPNAMWVRRGAGFAWFGQGRVECDGPP